jgi:hypothetical protein
MQRRRKELRRPHSICTTSLSTAPVNTAYAGNGDAGLRVLAHEYDQQYPSFHAPMVA